MALPVGATLGQYEVLSSLGAGGMGEVYRARDTTLGREVAIKVLPEAVAADPERLGRFEREARALAALNHPNVATLYGMERHAGAPFLVMEVVEGPTLADRIAEGAIPPEEAIPLFLQIAEGLEAAHEKGIIHRDLKPANVKLAGRDSGTDGRPSSWRVKILDFGLAKAFDPADPASSPAQSPALTASPTLTLAATVQGVILGTAAYMAPEQARGLPVDKRADVWAFGVCLFEALSGRRAFDGEDASVSLARVIDGEPDWDRLPRALPASLRRLLRRCLVKSPRQRLRDIGDARLALEEAAAEPPGEAIALGSNRRAPWATAVVAAVLAGVLAWMLKPSGQQAVRPSPSPARLTIALPAGFQVRDTTISPDGSAVAYVASDPEGDTALYLRRLDDFEPLTLSQDVNFPARPFFSPDGEWVGYFFQGSLMKVATTGGFPIRVAPAAAGLGGTWLDDDSIVYVAGFYGGLARVPSSGGEPESLTTPDGQSTYAHVFPQALPGRDEILFSTWGLQEGSAILSLASREWRPLTRNEENVLFSASGHLLSLGVPGEVRASAFDPDQGTARSPETTVLTNVADFWENREKWLGLSQNGTLAYVPGNFTRRRLVWVDREDLTREPISQPGAYQALSLSPDGRYVAFQALDQIHILDLERGTRVPLRMEPSQPGASNSQMGPVWAADGSSSVLFRSNHEGEWNLYRYALDGSQPLTRVARGVDFGTVVSGNGDIVFTSERNGNFDLYRLPPDGEAVPLLATPDLELSPSISPDGAYLAFVSNRTGRNEIYVAPYPSMTDPQQVSLGGGDNPRWSPKGGELFYASTRGVLSVAVEIGRELRFGRPVLVFESNLAGIMPFDVNQDATRFAVIERDPEMVPNRIHVIQNFFEELERLVPTR